MEDSLFRLCPNELGYLPHWKAVVDGVTVRVFQPLAQMMNKSWVVAYCDASGIPTGRTHEVSGDDAEARAFAIARTALGV